MRKPRVVIFNYSGHVQHDLITFFRNHGYETLVLTGSIVCPISGEEKMKTCPISALCCDVMVAVQDTGKMNSVDLFTRQFRLGCKLAFRNKAIITSSLVRDKLDDIIARGTTIFEDPLDFSAFEAWLKDCESRMELLQRLAVMRREIRHAYSKTVQFRFQREDTGVNAQAVNVSNCGICLKIPKPIKRGQKLQFAIEKWVSVEEGIVQWAKKLEGGWYLAGVTFCV
jgi:hypothetical protein